MIATDEGHRFFPSPPVDADAVAADPAGKGKTIDPPRILDPRNGSNAIQDSCQEPPALARVPELLDQIDGRVATFIADGAYDTGAVYEAAQERETASG